MTSRFWVNDATRYVRVTLTDDDAATAAKFGFREVTGAEFDSFRAETRAKHPAFFKGKGESQVTKHSHYHKSVEHLSAVDVYRVCDLFKVDDPSGATQHAIKKLLLPGGRGGGKTKRQDMQEAVDTLVRRLQMLDEDRQPNPVPCDWVTWAGGEKSPVATDQWVEVKLRSGHLLNGRSVNFNWGHRPGPGDIIAYRVIAP